MKKTIKQNSQKTPVSTEVLCLAEYCKYWYAIIITYVTWGKLKKAEGCLKQNLPQEITT